MYTTIETPNCITIDSDGLDAHYAGEKSGAGIGRVLIPKESIISRGRTPWGDDRFVWKNDKGHHIYGRTAGLFAAVWDAEFAPSKPAGSRIVTGVK